MAQGAVAVMSSSSQDSTLLKWVKSPLQMSGSHTLNISGGRSSLGREDSSASLSQLEQETLVQLRGEECTCLSASVQAPQCSVQEHLQQSTIGDGDTHLVEFSIALQTVTRALRQVAESKARAQDEAAEWKHKYEIERLRLLDLERRSADCIRPSSDSWSLDERPPESKTRDTETREPNSLESLSEPSGRLSPRNNGCCLKEGICNEQVLANHGSSQKDHLSDGKHLFEKAPFRLAWGDASANSGRHKHDIVSFENGNITTTVRNSKQITLVWDSPPRSVLILSKPNSLTVQSLCQEMVSWLGEKGMGVYVEPTVKKELLNEGPEFSFVQTFESEKEVLYMHKMVDLVITLGGDGTVLWAASLFKGPVPPLVAFSMGSLGFMTPFQSEQYRECLQTVMKGPVFITLRHRLHCRIVRKPENGGGDPSRTSEPEDYVVLNEVAIDRGMSSFITNLECYCDNLFVTSVQGDGIILSTPSGSTAYSLAAGGSMVHPQVPGMLFTPICPHSLSFRPLIFPEYATLRIQVPQDSRGQVWASFDGKDRHPLLSGDALMVHMSAWPVPAACDKESTNYFLSSVREDLHWNLRKTQLSDGPTTS